MSSAHCCDLFVQEREGDRGIWGGRKIKHSWFYRSANPPSFGGRAV